MEQSLPRFLEVGKAIASGGPFIIADIQIHPNEVPDDKWKLLHNALLLNTWNCFAIRFERDAKLVSSLLKEHRTLVVLVLEFKEVISKELFIQLASAIKTDQLVVHRSDGVNINAFMEALSSANGLTKLIIDFTPNQDEWESILSGAQRIKELQLSKSGNYCKVWPLLISGLSKNTSIKTLELNGLDDDGAGALVEILRINETLQNLNWLGSSRGEQNILVRAMDMFFEGYLRHQLKLKSLSVGTAIYDSSCKILREILKTNTSLTKLEIKNAGVNTTKIKIISEGLAVNTTLRTLNLQNPEEIGLKELCDALKKSNRLTTLDLYGTVINAEQCKIMAEMLEKDPALKSLKLACDSEGAQLICNALKNNKNLRELLLDHNQSDDLVPGTIAIGKMLAANTSLRRLEFFCEPDSHECIELLCSGLEQNTSLRSLKIHPFGTEVLESALAVLLQHNFALDTIDVVCINGFGQLLRRNRELKSLIRSTVAILSHNIARSHSALSILPREIWQSILSSITHPGMDDFNELVNGIFHLYTDK